MLTELKIKTYAKLIYYKGFFSKPKYDVSKPTVFIVDTPSHGNLGDHAIAYAEIEFIEKHFQNFQLFEVSEDDFNSTILNIKKHIKPCDIVILSGGGNLGNEYILDEKIRRKTIKLLSNNPIFIFPQTMYFTKTIKGFFQKQISRFIYKAHNNLTICAREEKSYELLNKYFENNNILLVPDIVLSLNLTDSNINRENKVLLLLRDDKESVVQEEEISKLVNIKCSEENYLFEKYDTVVKYNVNSKTRNSELNFIFQKIKKSSVVVTDRLHGMIFCAITSTPCIVLSNYNYKVKGVYERWLKKCTYIKFVDNSSDIIEYMSDLIKCNNTKNKYNNLCEKDFVPLIKEIRKCIEK